jgi:hypothetical protein
MSIVCTNLVGEHEVRQYIGTWENVTKMDLKKWGVKMWIGFMYFSVRWLDFVFTAMNLRVPLKMGNILPT